MTNPFASRQTAPLVQILRDPADANGFSRRDWAGLVRVGRALNLLGQLDHRLAGAGVTPPEEAHIRLRSHRNYADFIARTLLWETRLIGRAFAGTCSPVVLLKGAAYLALELPFARGRWAADIDILLPRESIETAENLLRRQGWNGADISAYDQHYYREWMHEVPPLRHPEREIELDMHHTIAPPVSRVRADGAALYAAAELLPAERLGPGLAALAPADRIIHSAVHQFGDNGISGTLRELIDMDGLLRQPAADDFWPALVARAEQFKATRPLYYATRYSALILGTPVADALRAGLERHAPAGPVRALMDALVLRCLVPVPAGPVFGAAAARQALYIRSHWVKMPPGLLARHLTHKALLRFKRT